MTSRTLSVLYWGSVVFVALVMGSAGCLFLFRLDGSLTVLHHLGYPEYFATLLGITRLAGVAAILLPVPKGLREWAYAGLTFDLLIVVFSILASGIRPLAIIQPVIVLTVVMGSYLCWHKRCARPGDS